MYQSSYRIDIGNTFILLKIDMNRKDTLLKKIYTMLHLLGFHKKDSALVVIGMKKEFILPEGYLEPKNYKTVREAIGALKPVAAGVADPSDSYA